MFILQAVFSLKKIPLKTLLWDVINIKVGVSKVQYVSFLGC